VGIDTAVVARKGIAMQAVKQLGAGEGLARVLCQDEEKVELQAG
jgi:hypothetical protein